MLHVFGLILLKLSKKIRIFFICREGAGLAGGLNGRFFECF